MEALYELSKKHSIKPIGEYKFYIHPNGDMDYVSGDPIYSNLVMAGLAKYRVNEKTLVVVKFK